MVFLILFIVPSAYTADNSLSAMGSRFATGFSKGKGSVRDLMIEGTIEAVTPESDEGTRRIQRNAVKYMLSTDSTSDEHWDSLHDSIVDYTSQRGNRSKYSAAGRKSRLNRNISKLASMKAIQGPVKNTNDCSSLEGKYTGAANYGGVKALDGVTGFWLEMDINIYKKKSTDEEIKVNADYGWFSNFVRKIQGLAEEVYPVKYYADIEVSGRQLHREFKEMQVVFEDNVIAFVAPRPMCETWPSGDYNPETCKNDYIDISIEKGETLFGVLFNCELKTGILQWGRVEYSSL